MNMCTTNFADRRCHSRIELMVPANAEINGTTGRTDCAGRILDISLGGARLEADSLLGTLNEVVEVVIEGIKARAEIVWRGATEIGIRFVEQGGQAVVGIFERLLLREHPTAARASA